MKVSFWISKRLRISSHTGRGVSSGAIIAVCGVALAMMVMELTLAVVTGFKHRITEKVVGFDAQISIGAPYSYTSGAAIEYVSLTPELQTAIADFGTEGSLTLQLPGMLKTDDNFAGILYVAYGEGHNPSFELSNMVEGEFPDYTDQSHDNDIVISVSIADALNLKVGDRVYSCFFVDGTMKMRRHNVAGLYESNLGEYDKVIAYASLSGLQNIAGIADNTGSRIDFYGFEPDDIEASATRLQQLLVTGAQNGTLDDVYPVTDVLHTGAIYFNWLSLLDTNVVVIFVLMFCVAGFTLISSLFIIVLDRIPTIGLLRSLGASKNMVARIFMNIGLRLCLYGIATGNVIAICLCLIQNSTHFLRLAPEMYYLKYVPVEMDTLGFILLNVAVFAVSWLVLYIPARAASRIDPTETMRYE